MGIILPRRLHLRGPLTAAWARLRLRLARGRPVLERVDGLAFVVLPDVFNGVRFRTGLPLARLARTRAYPGMSVLDMGTGCGLTAVYAARAGAAVTAVDLNPEAIRNVRINALLNRVDDCVVTAEGDLFAPVPGQRFDLVCFNPPYFTGRPDGLWDLAWRDDTGVFARFLQGLPGALAPGGSGLVMLSTFFSTADDVLRASGLAWRVLWSRDHGNETLRIVEVRPGEAR